MIILLPDDFKPLAVTQSDLVIASVAWGFTLGFGFLTTWTALKQTGEIGRRYGYSKIYSPYIVMIWLEILVCMIFSIICWLYLHGDIPPSFAFFFVILTTWALQVQFLLQIIINRVAILITVRKKVLRLQIGVAVLMTAINISVYCIWIPARLQVSQRYIHINSIWDRCEKCLYLLIDGALNYYFIRIVQGSLVRQGLVKYNRLLRFNQGIVILSLSMDCLIIGMMSLNNDFVYMQFHPVAYMIKLNIEMAMAEMIVSIASEKTDINVMGHHENAVATQLTKTFGTSKDVSWKSDPAETGPSACDITFNAKREVHVVVEQSNSIGSPSLDPAVLTKTWDERIPHSYEGQEEHLPLRDVDSSKYSRQDAGDDRAGIERPEGMGMSTKIWGPPEKPGSETMEFYP